MKVSHSIPVGVQATTVKTGEPIIDWTPKSRVDTNKNEAMNVMYLNADRLPGIANIYATSNSPQINRIKNDILGLFVNYSENVFNHKIKDSKGSKVSLSIADFGSGDGKTILFLLEQFFNNIKSKMADVDVSIDLTLHDCSDTMLEYAKGRFDLLPSDSPMKNKINVNCVRINLKDQSSVDAAFNSLDRQEIITCLTVLHWIPNTMKDYFHSKVSDCIEKNLGFYLCHQGANFGIDGNPPKTAIAKASENIYRNKGISSCKDWRVNSEIVDLSSNDALDREIEKLKTCGFSELNSSIPLVRRSPQYDYFECIVPSLVDKPNEDVVNELLGQWADFSKGWAEIWYLVPKEHHSDLRSEIVKELKNTLFDKDLNPKVQKHWPHLPLVEFSLKKEEGINKGILGVINQHEVIAAKADHSSLDTTLF